MFLQRSTGDFKKLSSNLCLEALEMWGVLSKTLNADVEGLYMGDCNTFVLPLLFLHCNLTLVQEEEIHGLN